MTRAYPGRSGQTMARTATTALNQLQDQIDAVRREAYAAGYAAAMQAIREVAGKPAPGAESADQSAGSQQRQGTRRRGRQATTTQTAAKPAQPTRQRQQRSAAKAPARRGGGTGSR